jgi:hypothetical protein
LVLQGTILYSDSQSPASASLCSNWKTEAEEIKKLRNQYKKDKNVKKLKKG